MPLKVVIDTNVLISSAWGGTPKKIIDLWSQGEIILCLSEEILREYLEVIARGTTSQDYCEELVALFQTGSHVEFVTPSRKFLAVKEDPEDNKFIECAIACDAKWIISGDFHLRKLRMFMGIWILSPSDFLKEYHQSIKENS